MVGNGPSLARSPLDLIAGKPSFACNNIHLIYNKTIWQPTHYVRAEGLIPEGADEALWIDSVNYHADAGIETYISDFFMTPKLEKLSNVHEVKHCHEHARMDYDDPHSPTEWHMPQPCLFGGSLIMAMQLALKEGYDELVLIGCDLNYRDNQPSHFTDGYEHGYEQPAVYANRNNLWGHLAGINYHSRRGLVYNVLNATIGGDLNLYPRVKLEDTL